MYRTLAYDSVTSEIVPSSPESRGQSQVVDDLKSTVESLREENALKQQAIQTASRLVRELAHENAMLKQKNAVLSTQNSELLDLLNAVVQRQDQVVQQKHLNVSQQRSNLHHASTGRQARPSNSKSKFDFRNAEKQRLKSKFRNFLSITTSSSASMQTFNQSCQSDLMGLHHSNENDPELANQSISNYSRIKHEAGGEVAQLRKRLERAERQIMQLAQASQEKQQRYLQVIESFGKRLR